MTQTTSSEVGARLRAHVRGQVWQEGDDGYDDARRVWNGAVDRRPAVLVRCADAADVRTALLVARESGVPLAVRGGGHDWAGRALGDGGVVLDLSALRGVDVDPGARVAVAQGGALVADVVDAAAASGLGTATAVVRTVGMAGMTLAGGYGGLAGRFGLALDNLLSAEVLLPDGTRVHAGADGDPELYWALRGGGGNFGIVTSARYRLHPLGPVLGGMVLYPLEQAVQVLRGYRDLIASAPDELTVMAGFVAGPTGEAAVFVAPTWSGDLVAGEAAVAPLERLGHPGRRGRRPDALPGADPDVRGRRPARPALRARHPLAPHADRRRDRRARRGRLDLAVVVVAAGPAPLPRRRHPGRAGRDRVRAAPGARARGGDRRVASSR